MNFAKGLNLSRWAVEHPAFILFLILASSLAGLKAYLSMGRAEDPSFTIKTAIVSATWPGASADQMQRQVAERSKTNSGRHHRSTFCVPSACQNACGGRAVEGQYQSQTSCGYLVPGPQETG